MYLKKELTSDTGTRGDRKTGVKLVALVLENVLKSTFTLPAALLVYASAAWAQAPTGNCNPLPVINPALSFTANFDNPCYALPFVGSSGSGSGGDSNATYTQVFYQVNPAYELVVLGTFPNARFMSASLNDSHLTVIGTRNDYQFPPLFSTMSNPYVKGAMYKPGQMYGFLVTFGGGSIKNVAAGCSSSGATIGETSFDATQIHQGMSWNGATDLPAGFPVHQTGANPGGTIMIREYMSFSTEPAPVVIVRQISNGCAVPLSQAVSMNLISNTQNLSTSTWINQSQILAHHEYFSTSTLSPTECYPYDPNNQVAWVRSPDWVGRNNLAAAYASTVLPTNILQSLLAGQTFIRIQFPLPTTPSIPCANAQCSLTGNEQTRYFSIEFSNVVLSTPSSAGTTTTYATLNDTNLVKDPNANVTLIVGLGGTPPSSVNAGNYYTYLDLTKVPGYQKFNSILVRNLLNNATFNCSTFNVPNYTMEYNPVGGFMGNFVPTVDFPTFNQLTGVPVPPIRPDTCGVAPPPPTACALIRTPV